MTGDSPVVYVLPLKNHNTCGQGKAIRILELATHVGRAMLTRQIAEMKQTVTPPVHTMETCTKAILHVIWPMRDLTQGLA
jgi:hypothetical protein